VQTENIFSVGNITALLRSRSEVYMVSFETKIHEENQLKGTNRIFLSSG